MNIKRKKKIITLIAGGTGGHIFPAISLLNFLKKKYYIIVVTDKRGSKYFFDLKKNKKLIYDFKLVIINIQSPFKNGFFNKFTFSFLTITSVFKLMFMFIKKKPDLLIGFGGYCSFTPCLVGKIMGIKFFIHEQNSMMGRANKFLEYFATSSFLGFKNTWPYKNIKKRIYSGTPIRKEFYKINHLKKVNDKHSLNLLIFGGSLGADFFSTHIPDVICSLDKKILKKINITHQVLSDKIKSVQSKYEANQVNANVKSFFPDIIKHFEKANLIIARAGGSTIAEILISQTPSVIFPLRNSLDNHQEINSKLILEKKIGWVYDENKFKIIKLKKLLNDFIRNKNIEKKIKSNFKIVNNELSNFAKNQLPNEIINQSIINILNSKSSIKDDFKI